MGRDPTQPAESHVPVRGPGFHRIRAGGSGGRVTGVERRLASTMLDRLGRPPIAFVLWNGEAVVSDAGPPAARIGIADRGALLRLMVNAESAFGDLYAEGRVTVEGDLVTALETVYRSMATGGQEPFTSRLARRSRGPWRANDAARSRANVHHHYDIGNDFYSLWLDRDHMQYTCAYYPRSGMTLEQAQSAKLQHVCRKLRLRPGERVIEAGGGWGGLALFMAREYGTAVRSFNLSHRQVAHARECARREGLSSRVEFIEEDYRAIRGDCDVFVSVGMLEHVGPTQYAELSRVIDNCLSPAGRGLIHTIGRNRPAPLNSWIEKRIFPGSYPPTLRQMMAIFEPRSFAIQDVENLRLHYAWTLQQWLERYVACEDRVRALFDERFVRTWRLYLAGSAAAFAVGSLQLFQLLFHRPLNSDLPRSRAYLYRAED